MKKNTVGVIIASGEQTEIIPYGYFCLADGTPAMTKIPNDRGYFKVLYEQHYSRLVSFAAAFLFDSDEAEDVVQEVFVYMWENSGKIDITGDIRSYLFTSVKNKSLNRIKHLNVIDAHSDRVSAAYLNAGIIPDDDADEELLVSIAALISEMPPQMRKVFELHSYSGLKYHEIATHLEISINTVKTHISRGFVILREKLLLLLF